MSETGKAGDRTSRSRGLGSLWLVAVVALVIVGLTAWRATLGMSLSDDGYYAATTLRLAQGARLFADEMFVQSLGFLAAVPFAKVWTWMFGTTGIVVALRLFYVALATAGAAVVYRLLRPSFGRWASLAAAAVPLIAPAYNLLYVTYDTMAALGMVLACVLAFTAARDSRRALAAASGAAAAFASVSYPPLALASFALLVTLAVRTRDRRLVGWMSAGAAAVVAVFAVWLLSTTPLADIGITYGFVVGGWVRASGPQHGTRIATALWQLGLVLGQRWKLPLWMWYAPAAMCGLSAALLGRFAPARRRARGIALMLLPAALAMPVFAEWSAHGRHGGLPTIGGNFLIAFVLFAALPMFLSLRGSRSAVRGLAVMALPVALVGFVLVELSSAAGSSRASGIVGLAPFVVAVVVWWAGEIADTVTPVAGAGAVVALVFALFVLLFGSAFKDDAPLALDRTIASGAYAGVTTGRVHEAEVAELGEAAAKWVRPSTTITIVGLPGAYLATGGVPLTNVMWLDPAAGDAATVAYLDRAGRWPDVVLVPAVLMDRAPSTMAADPFLSQVAGRYRFVERLKVTGLAVYALAGAGAAQP
jgi:hypothetical protein